MLVIGLLIFMASAIALPPSAPSSLSRRLKKNEAMIRVMMDVWAVKALMSSYYHRYPRG